MNKAEFLGLKPEQQVGIAIWVMEEIVTAAGLDYVYKPRTEGSGMCTYVHNGCADCLIGQILHKLGWSLEELQTVDDTSQTPIGMGAAIGAAHNFPEIGYRLRCVLSRAQRLQDSGGSWGEALHGAKSEAKSS